MSNFLFKTQDEKTLMKKKSEKKAICKLFQN